MCASWSNPFFGECNFGKRPFVEYLPVLMLPFAYGFHHFKTFARPMQITVKTLIIVFIVHNLGLFVVFNTCFDGGTWEWSRYFELIGKVLLLDKI
jgi:hypothetical protein